VDFTTALMREHPTWDARTRSARNRFRNVDVRFAFYRSVRCTDRQHCPRKDRCICDRAYQKKQECNQLVN